jgi:DNA-binding HxlR family transcriptional regulator
MSCPIWATRAFTELKRGIEGISQRMLTVTLRGHEREGIVTRTVCEGMPPNVSNQLTALGRSLLNVTSPVIEWSMENLPTIDAARARYEEPIMHNRAVRPSSSLMHSDRHEARSG